MTERKNRYMIWQDGSKKVKFARKMQDAVKIASDLLHVHDGNTVHIHDGSARIGQPKLFDVTPCTGEAHKNPFIDNCPICIPNWGFVIRKV